MRWWRRVFVFVDVCMCSYMWNFCLTCKHDTARRIIWRDYPSVFGEGQRSVGVTRGQTVKTGNQNTSCRLTSINIKFRRYHTWNVAVDQWSNWKKKLTRYSKKGNFSQSHTWHIDAKYSKQETHCFCRGQRTLGVNGGQMMKQWKMLINTASEEGNFKGSLTWHVDGTYLEHNPYLFCLYFSRGANLYLSLGTKMRKWLNGPECPAVALNVPGSKREKSSTLKDRNVMKRLSSKALDNIQAALNPFSQVYILCY